MAASAQFATISSALGFVALEAADALLFKPAGYSCLCPPLAAVAVLLFCLPKAPASQPRNVLGGHLVATAVALAVSMLLPPAYAIAGKTLVVAGSILAMSLTGTTHPPAAAFAYVFLATGMQPKNLLYPGFAGACILVAVQQVCLAVAPADKPKTN